MLLYIFKASVFNLLVFVMSVVFANFANLFASAFFASFEPYILMNTNTQTTITIMYMIPPNIPPMTSIALFITPASASVHPEDSNV